MPISAAAKGPCRAVHPRKHETIETIDWLALWGLSLGFCAIVFAGIADFVGHDNLGAAFILVGAAALSR